MNPAFDFRVLSVGERLQLVEDLWESIAAESPDEALPMTPEVATELDRRLEEHEADPSTAISWDQARARVPRGKRRSGE